MNELIPYGSFVVALIGVILGGVRYTQSTQNALRKEMADAMVSLENELKTARLECVNAQRMSAQSDQEIRLHIAENYATKAGLAEQTAQIMKALEGIGTRIDGIGVRIDRFYDAPKPRTRNS